MSESTSRTRRCCGVHLFCNTPALRSSLHNACRALYRSTAANSKWSVSVRESHDHHTQTHGVSSPLCRVLPATLPEHPLWPPRYSACRSCPIESNPCASRWQICTLNLCPPSEKYTPSPLTAIMREKGTPCCRIVQCCHAVRVASTNVRPEVDSLLDFIGLPASRSIHGILCSLSVHRVTSRISVPQHGSARIPG